MSELKPIEEGCLALTINCHHEENNGKIVTVLECLGLRRGLGVIWRIDYFGPGTLFGFLSNRIPESRLMRIDDPDLKEEKEEELVYIEDES